MANCHLTSLFCRARSNLPARTHQAPPPPAPVQAAPPQPQQPGLFGQMAATAGGVAIGSAIGHTVGHAVTGLRNKRNHNCLLLTLRFCLQVCSVAEIQGRRRQRHHHNSSQSSFNKGRVLRRRRGLVPGRLNSFCTVPRHNRICRCVKDLMRRFNNARLGTVSILFLCWRY